MIEWKTGELPREWQANEAMRKSPAEMTGCIIYNADVGLEQNSAQPGYLIVRFPDGGIIELAPGSRVKNVFFTGTSSVGRRKTNRKLFLKPPREITLDAALVDKI